MINNKRILILDELVARPGMAAACRSAYRTRYVPGAERRGMRLDGAWQSPPGRDYPELSATLYWLWSVPDVRGWWTMRFSRTADGADERFEKLRWWQEVEALTVSRKRSLLTAQPGEE